MSNLGLLLKEQMTRIARKELREPLDLLKKASTAYRRDIAALKKQVAALQKQVASAPRTSRASVSTAKTKPAKPAKPTRHRFSAKGVVALRDRLGLSQGDFGKLTGVSAQSVINWERGTALPRPPQLEALAALRGIGKREAVARLVASGHTPTKRRRRRSS